MKDEIKQAKGLLQYAGTFKSLEIMVPTVVLRYLVGEVERLSIALHTHESYDKTVSELHEENERLEKALEKWNGLRPEVQWFAEQMEAKLTQNDHKGGWKDCDFRYLYRRLHEEWHEIWQAYNRPDFDWKLIQQESVDVANFAMMIADIARERGQP